jgi:hypothetical protein
LLLAARAQKAPAEQMVSGERELRAVDVLFTDSITNDYVRHPAKVTYRLLSDESLREIANVKLRG